MKTFKSCIPGLLIIAAIFAAAGCSGKKTTRSGADDFSNGEIIAPDKVVERLFASFQFDELDDVASYFSKEIDPEIVKKFARSFSDKRQVMKFKTFTVKTTGTKSQIKLLYSYKEKASQGAARNNIAKIFVGLVKEDKLWKIRAMGMPELDNAVEKDIFNQCLSAVMDATIAQEKLRQKEDKYSTIIGSLMKFYPIDEKACSEMAVESADEKTYLISAVTKNSPPCLITGNTDEHFPRSFDECPGTMLEKKPGKIKVSK